MKQRFAKTLLLATAVVTLSSAVLPTLSYASGVSTSVNENNTITSNSAREYVDDLQPYVRTTEKGTLYLDPSYTNKVDVPEEVIQSIEGWMAYINEDIEAGIASVNSNYEVIYNKSNSSDASIQAVKGGVDEVRTFWWGFEVWLSHSTTDEIILALVKGAAASKIAEIMVKRIPGTPAKVATLILEIATWAAGSGAGIFKANDKGNGIYLSFLWPVHPGLLPFSSIDPQY